MIKVQKKDFDIEKEIKIIKDKYSNIGAVNSFIGYVRDLNQNKDVKYLELEVYQEMAIKELSKIRVARKFKSCYQMDKIVQIFNFGHKNSQTLTSFNH